MKASRPPPAGPIIINQYMHRGQSQIKRVQSAGGRGCCGEREGGARGSSSFTFSTADSDVSVSVSSYETRQQADADFWLFRRLKH